MQSTSAAFRQLYSPLRLLIPVARHPRLAEALHGNVVSIVPVVVQRQHFTRELASTESDQAHSSWACGKVSCGDQ